MNTRMMSAAVVMTVVAVLFGTGCSASAQQPQPAHAAQVPAKWQTVVLADGVEIRVSEEAGPDATMVVEQIQKEMRSRYIGARQ